MREATTFGRFTAPEHIAWASHVRWAIENEALYVLDLRRDGYFCASLKKLHLPSFEEHLRARGLLGAASDRDAVHTTCGLGTGNGSFWSFWAAMLWARRVMKRRQLDVASKLLQGANISADARVDMLVARFQDWRPLYPRPARCLFDSLALGRFLWSAGIRANLIFAVRGEPFSAHAWLEMNGDIINDEPEYCASFTRMVSR